MKKFIGFILMLMSISSFAQTVEFDCEQYSAQAESINDSTPVNVVLDLSTKMAWVSVKEQTLLSGFKKFGNNLYTIDIDDNQMKAKMNISASAENIAIKHYVRDIVNTMNLHGQAAQDKREELEKIYEALEINSVISIPGGEEEILLSCKR